MKKRLKDFSSEECKTHPAISDKIVVMQFGNDEATKRIVLHSAKRVIQQHKEELLALAYK